MCSNTIIESYSSNRCIRTIRTSGLNFQRYIRTCNGKGITWLHPVLSWQLMVLTSLLCPYPFLLAGQMFRCLSSLCLCDSFPWRIFLAFLAKKRFRPILSIWKMRSDEMIWFVDMWFKESKTLRHGSCGKRQFWFTIHHRALNDWSTWWKNNTYLVMLPLPVWVASGGVQGSPKNAMSFWWLTVTGNLHPSVYIYIYPSKKVGCFYFSFLNTRLSWISRKQWVFLPHVFPLHLITYRTYYILKQIHTFKDSPTKILPTFFHPPQVYSIL